MSSNKQRWDEVGQEPDYRFSLANERTFLAWIRTALAILAGALVLHQLRSLLHIPPALDIGGVVLAVLAGTISVGAYFHWRKNQKAMRLNEPLPRSTLLPILVAAVVAVSIALAWTVINRL